MKRNIFITLLSVSFLLCAEIPSIAQIPTKLNYDKKPIHYGILVGYNQMMFDVKMKPNSSYIDTLFGISSFYAPGLHVGVLADLRLNEYMNIRLIPTLSLNQRTVDYYFKINDPEALTETYTKTAESVFGEIPIEMKIRSKRWLNFRPYLIGGVRYTFDFLSLRKIENLDEREHAMKLESSDFLYTIGTGFDFYFKYFKFAIELKMSFGTNDLLIKDGNMYTDAIESITSRVFNFTLTFE